jgi:lipoyl synthase
VLRSDSNSASPPKKPTDEIGPKPPWLKVRAPGGENYSRLKQTLRKLDLYTVCEEARCPNVGECWASGTATIMLLGHTCTRGCRFCAVTTGNPRGAFDPREPEHVARAISELGLRYVVLTMVDRDDLIDGGASQVAQTVRGLRERCPELLVETLVGDFRGRLSDVDVVLESAPAVFAHNVEVTRRITPLIRDARCDYDLSLRVLRHAKRRAPDRLVKSSIMVGIGETNDEVKQTLADLREAGVDIVTLGQYLRPTPKHAKVARWVTPDEFAIFEAEAQSLGFAFVASGALVRSSYHAAEGFVAARLRPAAALPDGGEGERGVSAANESSRPRSENAAPSMPLIPVGALFRKTRTHEPHEPNDK